MSYHVRWMIRRDMSEVELCGVHTNQEDLWPLLRKRNVIGMVAEHETVGTIDGYIIYELHKHHLKLLALVGHPINWVEAVQALINKVVSKLSTARRHKMVITVNEYHTQTIKILKDNHFECTRLRRRAFGDADGLEMTFKTLVNSDNDA